jgi:CHAD domain-containing protein
VPTIAASPKRPPRVPSAKADAESLDALRRRESVRNGLIRIGRRHATAALHRIEQPKKADRTEDIHFVRVQCKRLRALLRLLKPVTDVEAAERENLRLREAGRALSGFRDAFVAGETFQRVFEGAAPRHMRDASRLLGVKRAQTKSQQDLDTALKECARALHHIADEFRQLPISARGWATLASGLEHSYRRARKDFERCADRGAGHLGHCFHDWRKGVKNLGYQLEIFANLDNKEFHQLRKNFRRLGSLLGEDHDLIVFAEHVREREKHYAGLANFRPVRKRLRRRLKELRAREFALARKTFADKPRLWLRSLAEVWKLWKNPDAGALVLTIDQPEPPAASPRSLGAAPTTPAPVTV